MRSRAARMAASGYPVVLASAPVEGAGLAQREEDVADNPVVGGGRLGGAANRERPHRHKVVDL